MADSGDAPQSKAVATFKKPVFKKRAAAVKAPVRRKGEDSSGSEDDSGVVLADKKRKANLHTFSTTAGKKTKAQGYGVGADDSDGGDDPSTLSTFKSKRDVVPQKVGGGATSMNELETAYDRDARAVLERSIKVQAEAEADGDVKIYRGQAGYKQYIQKTESQVSANKITGAQGPIRGPQYARMTSVFDYQPNICKDYKETGYCGFGDSCIFLHDRGDYKAGWQQEQEWNDKQKKKEKEALRLLGDGGEEEEGDEEKNYEVGDDDNLPFACFICREAFKDPVVTMCNHYFCQQCAQDSYKNSTRCAACGKQTLGIFNRAKKLVDFMTKKGLLQKKSAAEDQEESFEVREKMELTSNVVSTVSRGGWEVVTEDSNAAGGST